MFSIENMIMNNILFCMQNFTLENIPLQPWLTMYRVSQFLYKKKYDIHVLTDVCHQHPSFEHITLHYVPSFRRSHGTAIINKIRKINPKFVVLTITPCSLVLNDWYKILSGYKTFGFASYPFYNFTEVKKGYFRLRFKDKIQYGKNFVIPDLFWARSAHECLRGIICQSMSTMQRIKKKSKNIVTAYSIPPGIDKNVSMRRNKSSVIKSESSFVYAGSLQNIRGFDLLLDSFKSIKYPDITLVILARGATQRQIDAIWKKVGHFTVNVQIVGGWLDKEQFAQTISSADATLLPFLLVPSELPVTVMESIVLGTPVIVSDIAGLSEASGPAGILVEPGSHSSLRKAIVRVHTDHALKSSLKQACLFQRERYSHWDQVGQKWLDLLEGGR